MDLKINIEKRLGTTIAGADDVLRTARTDKRALQREEAK